MPSIKTPGTLAAKSFKFRHMSTYLEKPSQEMRQDIDISLVVLNTLQQKRAPTTRDKTRGLEDKNRRASQGQGACRASHKRQDQVALQRTTQYLTETRIGRDRESTRTLSLDRPMQASTQVFCGLRLMPLVCVPRRLLRITWMLRRTATMRSTPARRRRPGT